MAVNHWVGGSSPSGGEKRHFRNGSVFFLKRLSFCRNKRYNVVENKECAVRQAERNYMKSKFFLLLSLFLLLISCNTVKYKRFVETLPAPSGAVSADIRYRDAFRRCSLDIYWPEGGCEKMPIQPAPVYVFIHGGSWMVGSKDFIRLYEESLIEPLRERGVVVVSVGYRFVWQTPFPNLSKDIHAAMEYLRRESETYRLDMNRVVIHGQSAGAHLAMLEGLRYPEGIRLIVDEFGPADLVAFQKDQPAVGIVSKRIRKQESPTEWVSAGMPPMIIWHGDADTMVPISQSEILIEKIKSVGGQVRLNVVPGADHGYINLSMDKTIEVSREICSEVLKALEVPGAEF